MSDAAALDQPGLIVLVRELGEHAAELRQTAARLDRGAGKFDDLESQIRDLAHRLGKIEESGAKRSRQLTQVIRDVRHVEACIHRLDQARQRAGWPWWKRELYVGAVLALRWGAYALIAGLVWAALKLSGVAPPVLDLYATVMKGAFQ